MERVAFHQIVSGCKGCRPATVRNGIREKEQTAHSMLSCSQSLEVEVLRELLECVVWTGGRLESQSGLLCDTGTKAVTGRILDK